MRFRFLRLHRDSPVHAPVALLRRRGLRVVRIGPYVVTWLPRTHDLRNL